jgi:hypothetical protein
VSSAPAHGGHGARGACARSGAAHGARCERGGRRVGGSGPASAGGLKVERGAR